MKIKENVTLYICDHCGKKYQVKNAAIIHEQFCFRNPVNTHKCFEHCDHLIKGKEIFAFDDHPMGGEFSVSRTSFQCGISGKYMYSFIAEKRNIVPVYNDVEESREYERMPLQCDDYKVYGL
jgi:hypothetical protein